MVKASHVDVCRCIGIDIVDLWGLLKVGVDGFLRMVHVYQNGDFEPARTLTNQRDWKIIKTDDSSIC